MAEKTKKMDFISDERTGALGDTGGLVGYDFR